MNMEVYILNIFTIMLFSVKYLQGVNTYDIYPVI